VFVEFPIFVTVAAKPIATVVMPLIGETNRDAVFSERPDFLNKPVVEFPFPFPGQKRFDRRATLQEFGTVTPATIRRVAERHALRIARVPRILGRALSGSPFRV